MNPEMLAPLIPMVATLIVFGMPVAIVFINRYFKLKNRELELDAEHQKKWTEEQRRQLEARVQNLEVAMQATLQTLASRGPLAQPAMPAAPQGIPPLPTAAQQFAQVADGPPQSAPADPGQPGRRERT